jgi:uncharacterized protein (DUF58 family)
VRASRLGGGLVRGLSGPLGRLTTRGRAVLSAGVTAAVCSLALGQRDLLRVGILLGAVPLLTTLALGRTRYRLACSRSVVPRRVPAGGVAEVVVEIANVSDTRCGTVLAEEQVPYGLGPRPRFVLPGLVPGERRAISYQVRPQARGRYQVGPLALTLTDPFGMGEHRRTFTARDEILVVPGVQDLAPIGLGGDWSGSGDTRPRAIVAAGEDDVTTREYRQGDDLRRVHWRSTARRGELMVRREEQPWRSRATLVLDRRRRAHLGDGPASTFEWAVDAIASVAVHLAARGYSLRLVGGGSTGAGARIEDSTGHVGSSAPVLDALATVATAGEQQLHRAAADAARTAAGGLVVAVLGQLDEADLAILGGLLQPGTRAIAVLAGSSTGPVVAGPVLSEAERRGEHLRASGWEVAVAQPGEDVARAWLRLGSGQHPTTAVPSPGSAPPQLAAATVPRASQSGPGGDR